MTFKYPRVRRYSPIPNRINLMKIITKCETCRNEDPWTSLITSEKRNLDEYCDIWLLYDPLSLISTQYL